MRKYAETIEFENARFYRKAARQARDPAIRDLLARLAEAEERHERLAESLERRVLTPAARAKEDETARRMFVLQYVQPGLAGLDGTVSRLAPVFAAAFATHDTWATFLVGLAGRRRHFHGLRRGVVPRRLADRPRLALAARRSVRRDDPRWAGSGTPCPISSRISSPRPRRPSWSSWSNSRRSPLSATDVLGGVLVFLAGILIGSS